MDNEQLAPIDYILFAVKVAVCVLLILAFPYVCIFSIAIVADFGLWEYFSACIVLLFYITVPSLLFSKKRKQLAYALVVLYGILILACIINFLIIL